MARRGAGPGAEARKLLPRLEPASSGRGGAGRGWGGIGALPRVGETQMSEDPSNDARIVDGGDQAHPAPIARTGQHVGDSKLCTSATMRYIDARQGRFITVLPRTRAEDAFFRDWLQTHTPAR